MSQTFRPVKETWYEHIDRWIDHDQVIETLQNICECIDSQCKEDEYGEVTAFWIEKGKEFLLFLASDDFNVDVLPTLESDDIDPGNALLESMQSMVGPWAKAIDKYGSLRFYID